MISRVLVPMDGSEMAERALRYAFEAHPDAEITVLHVVGGPSSMMSGAASLALADDPEGAARASAEGTLERAREIAAECGGGVETDVRVGSAARTIAEAAEAFDTVVVGRHSGGIVDRLFVGDVAKAVVRRSPVPVTVVR